MNDNAFSFRKPLPPAARAPQHKGLDWQAIRQSYEANATPEELDGPFDAHGNLKDAPRQASAQEARARGGRNSRGGPPKKIDRQLVRQLHADGRSTAEIARELNASWQGIHQVLKELKLK